MYLRLIKEEQEQFNKLRLRNSLKFQKNLSSTQSYKTVPRLITDEE